jgi:hypothetical protein
MADFSIQGKLGLDIAGLQRGVSAAQGELKKLASEATGATGAFGRMATAVGPAGMAIAVAAGAATIAVGALAAGLAVAVSRTLEYGGHLTDLAAKTGISTTSLQTLGHVGSMVGVSMDEIGNAVGKMQRNLVNGSEAFAKLGLSIADLRAMAPEKAFEEISQKIASIKDPAGQAAAAIEVFGRSGVSLLPAMKENMAQLRAEAMRLGFVMSKDMVASADALGDRFTTLNSTFQGMIRNIGSVVTSSNAMHLAVKGITEVMGSFSTSIRDSQNFLRLMVDLGIEQVVRGLAALSQAIGFALTQFSNFKIGIIGITTGLQEMLVASRAMHDAWNSPLRALDILKKAKEDIARLDLKAQLDAQKEMQTNSMRSTVINSVTAKLEKLADTMHKTAGQQIKFDEAAKKGGAGLDFLGKKSEEASKQIQDSLIESQKQAEKNAEEMNKVWEQEEKDHAEWVESNRRQNAEMAADDKRLTDLLKKEADERSAYLRDSLKEMLKGVADDAKQGASVISGAFNEMFSGFGIGGFGSGLTGLFDKFADSAAEAFSENRATDFQKKLTMFLSGNTGLASQAGISIGSAFVSGFASVVGSTTPGSTKGIFPSIMQGFQAGAATGNPFVAAAGAVAGGEFALGASGEIKKRLGKVGEIIASVAFPVIGAGTIFGKLFGGDKAEKEAKRIAENLQSMTKTFLSANGGIDALKANAAAANVSLDALFDAKTPQEYQTAVEAVSAAVTKAMELEAAAQTKAIDDTKAAMDRYGLTMSDMGIKWQQQELDKKALQLFSDYSLLTAAGADHNMVIEKMGPSLNTYVQESIKAKTTIPESMKPVLQSMLDAGLLTDEAGNKMESLGGLTFAQTLESAVGSLVEEIHNLVNALNGIHDVSATVTITTIGKIIDPSTGLGERAGSGGPAVPSPAEEPMNLGGVSTGPTPAFLHGTPSNPELVGPADALARSIGQGLAAGMAGSGNGAPMQSGPVQLIVDKRVLAEVLADVRRQEMR